MCGNGYLCRMDKRMRGETLLMVKYGLVGVVNTAVTAGAYFVLRWLGVQIDIANFLSYVAGILNSFVLNKLWVFRQREGRWLRQGSVFFFGALLCWALQWAAFRGLLLVMPERWAYLVAMCVYPGLNYLFNRLVTFRRGGGGY